MVYNYYDLYIPNSSRCGCDFLYKTFRTLGVNVGHAYVQQNGFFIFTVIIIYHTLLVDGRGWFISIDKQGGV